MLPMGRIQSQRQPQSDCSIGGSSSRGGDLHTLDFKMQIGENLMQYRPTMSCVVQFIARDYSGVILIDLC